MKSRQFEREVIIAHCLKHIYFNIERAIDIFLQRELKKEWDEEETRDSILYMLEEADLFADGSRGLEENSKDAE